MPAKFPILDSLPDLTEIRAWIEGSSQPRVTIYLPLASEVERNARQRDQFARDLQRALGMHVALLALDADPLPEQRNPFVRDLAEFHECLLKPGGARDRAPPASACYLPSRSKPSTVNVSGPWRGVLNWKMFVGLAAGSVLA